MASQGNMGYFIMEVASYNFLYNKTSKEYKNTEIKICINYIIMIIGSPEYKDVISKNFKFNALHSADSVAENQ